MTQEPITFDPSAWTGMKPRQWPNPVDHPHPLPLEARESWHKRLRVDCSFTLLGGLSLGMLLLRLITAPSPKTDGAVLVAVVIATAFLVMFLAAITAIGVALLWDLYRHGVSSLPVIAMDAHRLTIPRWFEDPIPWSEITDVACPWGGSIAVTIRDEGRFRPTMLRTLKTSWCSVPAEVPGQLDISKREIFRAMQAHRAHFGNGGQSG